LLSIEPLGVAVLIPLPGVLVWAPRSPCESVVAVERNGHSPRRCDRIDPIEVLVGQRHRQGAETVRKLLDRPRPDDGTGDSFLLDAPCESKLANRTSLVDRDLFERVQHVESCLGQNACGGTVPKGIVPRTLWRCFPRRYRPVRKPPAVGDHGMMAMP